MLIEKYSFGMGDRFGLEGKAQLLALVKAKEAGVDIAPVWNKSHREHTTIHTEPQSLRDEADQAIKDLGWQGNYYLDADHIGLKNVDLFMDSHNFFTLDVADNIGEAPSDKDLKAYVDRQEKYLGELNIPGIDRAFKVTREVVEGVGMKFLSAAREAGRIYRHIESAKGKDNFVTEVSMDETAEPQSPLEMFFILAAIAGEGIPAQTIAPRFSGRFNKGVDYVGDPDKLAVEVDEDLAVIAFAISEFGLPSSLKLSVHSGSDKFSIFEKLGGLLKKHDAGLHIKTAGTTWLEELIGLAEAGGEGLELAKEVYSIALGRFDELCGPYAEVIDIDADKLPSAETVKGWDSQRYVTTLRHNLSDANYNPNFRQLLHVGYKVAAEMGDRYLDTVKANEEVVARNVTENFFDRHVTPLFL